MLYNYGGEFTLENVKNKDMAQKAIDIVDIWVGDLCIDREIPAKYDVLNQTMSFFILNEEAGSRIQEFNDMLSELLPLGITVSGEVVYTGDCDGSLWFDGDTVSDLTVVEAGIRNASIDELANEIKRRGATEEVIAALAQEDKSSSF